MKLILVDPFVTSVSPTMRGIVASLDAFKDLFDEIEVWATECEWEHPKVRIRPVPRPFKPWTLHSHYFAHVVRRRAAGFASGRDHLIQTSGCILPRVDIRYIQFWNQLLLEEATKRPQLALKGIQSIQSRIAARAESSVVRSPKATGQWWVVSRALANSIKNLANGIGTFQILPNQYDPTRFNAEVRNEWRERMRNEHGFKPDEHVLAFSAFGHFERKGLRQGVEAVEKLRQLGHPVRFLILGGGPGTVDRFRNSLSEEQRSACVFTGLVDGIERHLVAADGFLFPSHFEAFSLAEIEAAALGLRLYLTPHYGSEMILREPANGRMLPWDPVGMAGVIAKDIVDGTLGRFHSELAEATTKEDYAKNLVSLYQAAITLKQAR